MSKEDKEILEKEMQEKVRGLLKERGAIFEFFSFNLRNFSYRYFESATTGEAELLTPDDKTIIIQAFEPHLASALKTECTRTRKGLIEMAKSFTKKEAPRARYQIGVEIKHQNAQDGGDFNLFCEVHWGFPTYQDKNKANRKEESFSYSDSLDLRNTFAKNLDGICEVF